MVCMVTGDNINTTKALARECGILTNGMAIKGPDFHEKGMEELLKIISKIQLFIIFHYKQLSYNNAFIKKITFFKTL
ncbi:putative P-type Ca(2+) transporter [Helianthus annuus]|nr:putative P-type Ca(2+) transporter [Helianthus annuus]